MKLREYIFKHLFKKESKELDKKRRELRIANESIQFKNVELRRSNEKIKRLEDEKKKLKLENDRLLDDLVKAKRNIIESNEYKMLLEKYNELIRK